MMKLDKEWIKKLDEKSLEFLLNHDEAIEKAPDSLEYKIFTKIDNLDFDKEDKIGLKNIILKKPLRLAFITTALIILMITVFSLIFFRGYLNTDNNRMISKVENIEGNIIIQRNDEINKIKKNEKIRINDAIKTAEKSNFDLKLSNNSRINIKENTDLKIIQYQKKNKNEIFEMFLIRGKIICDIKLPTKESRFIVSTKTNRVVVKGTKFVVEVLENDDVKIEVAKGRVWMDEYIKTNIYLDKIKDIDAEIYNNLQKFSEHVYEISTGQKIYIEKKHIDMLNENYKRLSKDILSSIKGKSELTKSEKKLYINLIKDFEENSIQKIEAQYNNDITDSENIKEDNTDDINDESNDINDENELFKISKLAKNPKLLLEEKYTAVTSNEKNRMLITSDFNKSVYYIDLKNGNLLWQFKNENLKKITSAAFYFKNMIILSSPDRIFVLNEAGSIIKEKKIDNGPIYWAAPVKNKNNIFIPVSGTVYKFDGKSFIEIKNIARNGGQVYLTLNSDNLIFTDLNERNLNCFNLEKNKIILSSDKFVGRSFIAPVVKDNYVFTADSTKNIYKYSKELNTYEVLEIENGITSNIIIKNNKLYFVDINGIFCTVDSINFKSYNKILKIEKNPTAEKFFTKKLLSVNNYIFYSSDNGKIFYYNVIKNKWDFIEIDENKENLSLIGTPIFINKTIYFLDTKSNIYTLEGF